MTETKDIPLTPFAQAQSYAQGGSEVCSGFLQERGVRLPRRVSFGLLLLLLEVLRLAKTALSLIGSG